MRIGSRRQPREAARFAVQWREPRHVGFARRVRRGCVNLDLTGKALLAALLVMVATTTLAPQKSPPDGVKFEVVSVRALSDKEAAERSPDFLGPNIAVRLRLSTTSTGLDFYGWKNSVIPAGYKVRRTDRGIVWFYGKGGTEKKTASPGLKAVLFGSVGTWITLPDHSAPEEVVSDTFVVPSDATAVRP